MARRGKQRLSRDIRLAAARARHPHASFGAGCDVRSGLHLMTEGAGRISFGDRCVLDRDLTVECFGELTVGDRTVFGHRCTIGVRSRVSIGADSLIAEMVSIRDHDHRFADLHRPVRDQGVDVADVVIGRNVWLGSKVTVLKGVRIGDGAIVGAGAVVTRDIPAGAIALGVPARVLRYREQADTAQPLDEENP